MPTLSTGTHERSARLNEWSRMTGSEPKRRGHDEAAHHRKNGNEPGRRLRGRRPLHEQIIGEEVDRQPRGRRCPEPRISREGDERRTHASGTEDDRGQGRPEPSTEQLHVELKIIDQGRPFRAAVEMKPQSLVPIRRVGPGRIGPPNGNGEFKGGGRVPEQATRMARVTIVGRAALPVAIWDDVPTGTGQPDVIEPAVVANGQVSSSQRQRHDERRRQRQEDEASLDRAAPAPAGDRRTVRSITITPPTRNIGVLA